MSNKRNNELVSKVDSILESDAVKNNISLEDRKELRSLLHAYEGATYKEYDDRHQFYREMVSNMTNDYGFKDKELAYAMAHDHPTLQQSFMRFVCMFINDMANNGYTDGRNERSVELAKALAPIIAEKGYLPMI